MNKRALNNILSSFLIILIVLAALSTLTYIVLNAINQSNLEEKALCDTFDLTVSSCKTFYEDNQYKSIIYFSRENKEEDIHVKGLSFNLFDIEGNTKTVPFTKENFVGEDLLYHNENASMEIYGQTKAVIRVIPIVSLEKNNKKITCHLIKKETNCDFS